MHVEGPTIATGAVVALALAHVISSRLIGSRPARPSWLSAASGISVAYVFLDLLPSLADYQKKWLTARPQHPIWLEEQVYIFALLGLVASYGLEGFVTSHRGRFQYALGSFAAYNLLIGYLAANMILPWAAILGVLAFGAHFLVNDWDLRREDATRFDTIGRWILAASLVAGWLLGRFLPQSDLAAAACYGLLGGGIILNVMKEEMEREIHFAPFAAGVASYSALLLAAYYGVRT